MERFSLLASGINGFLAVALGAFGAHGLKARLADAGDGAERLGWWETASHYHLAHALALGLVAYVAFRVPGTAPRIAAYAFALGIVLFSGSLYVMTLTGQRALGAVTPLGGLSFLVGWGALIAAAWGLRS
jgi:uncharacterized membrane protein YgdD (TMEM256/DUF423 family)